MRLLLECYLFAVFMDRYDCVSFQRKLMQLLKALVLHLFALRLATQSRTVLICKKTQDSRAWQDAVLPL